MKNRLLWLTATLLSAVMITSCRYKDGPKFTLRSAEGRLINSWSISQVLENGVDKTSDFKTLFKNWTFALSEDHKYTLSHEFFTVLETGTWELQEERTKLNLKKDGTGTNIWTITRLKTDDCWIEQTQGNGDVIKYRLVPSSPR